MLYRIMLTSKSPRKVMRLAYVLARDGLPAYSCKFSRRDFTLPQLFACLILKALLKRSYRGTEELLADCPDWCPLIGLKKVPDHNTLCHAARWLLSTCRVNRLLDLLAQWAQRAKLLRREQASPGGGQHAL